MNKDNLTISKRQMSGVITFVAGKEPDIPFAILMVAYYPQGNVKATHCRGTQATYPKQLSHP